MQALQRRPGFVALTLLAAGCAVVGEDYESPTPALPNEWRGEPDSVLVSGEADLEQWWRLLDDPVLDQLVERAVNQGLDVRAALARVREARALRGIAAGERFPTLDGVASFQHIAESQNTPFGAFTPDTNLYTAG